MKYYEQLEASGFTANDGYNGPLLVIKLLNDQRNSLQAAVLPMRDSKICALQTGDELTLSYQLDNSTFAGTLSLKGGKTLNRKVVIKIVDGALAWVGQSTYAYERDSIFRTSSTSSLFQCGKL